MREEPMTRGERLVASIPLKTSFYDSHERRAYLRMVEVARKIVDDPALIKRGRRFLERFIQDKLGQSLAYKAWANLLAEPPETIARELLSNSERGSFLRDSAPVFVVLSAPEASERQLSE
jgi:hypothetical protein